MGNKTLNCFDVTAEYAFDLFYDNGIYKGKKPRYGIKSSWIKGKYFYLTRDEFCKVYKFRFIEYCKNKYAFRICDYKGHNIFINHGGKQ